MPSPDAKSQSRRRAANDGYENRDANAKWLFGVVIGLTLALLIMHFVLSGILGRMEKSPAPRDHWINASSATLGAKPPPPNLQISSTADLKTFRAKEEHDLTTYGWVDKSAGIARVPIDRAMDLVLQQGLPTRTGTNESATGPSAYELQQQRTNSAGKEIRP
jgi:hypothetical protein